MIFVSIAVLLALLAAAGWTLATRRPGPAHLLAVLAVLWLFTNAWLEGPVLWTLDAEHGLVLADLLTPLAVLLAGWRLLTVRRAGVAARRRQGGASAIPVRSDRPG